MSAGPPALLLHGQPGAARDWDRVRSALGDSVQAIAFDRPGWDGRSAPRDIAGNAAAALSVLDASGVSEPAVVVGHSFGAAVACWLAASQPTRVARLVLLAPAANVASLYALDRWLAAPVLGELSSAVAVGAPAAVLRSGWARRSLGRRLGLDDSHLGGVGRTFANPRAWRAFTVEQRSLVRDLPVLEARLVAVKAPAQVLIGTHDWIVPVSSAQTLARQLPHAKLAVVSRAGHLLPLTRAEAVADAISGRS
ncbi:MAG: alpha/beta fold hydrolase [Solirubrobacteraceae bacterium]